MNSYDIRILKIKEGQIELLTLAKAKLQEEEGIFNDNIRNLIRVLGYDSSMTKRHLAIIRAQELIEKYINDIINATSVEEIVRIRKSLNYYINKIKKEIVLRHIAADKYDEYVSNITDLRKGIVDYVRFLKRERKISEMEYLNNKPDLTSDEDLRLRELLRNESYYYKRNINKPADKKEGKEKKQDVSLKEYYALGKYIVGTIDSDGKVRKSVVGKYFIGGNNPSKEDAKGPRKEFPRSTPPRPNTTPREASNLHDYLSEKVDSYINGYDVIIPNGYGEDISGNIRIFINNLYTLFHNKRRIKYMVNDTIKDNYSEPVLIACINYVMKESSIINSFRKAIKGSKLLEKDEFYTQEHERCIEYIKKLYEKVGKSIEYYYPGIRA